MFSDQKVIEASRDFVCVRLESYESKEYQDLARKFLRGSFANTAFCVLAPDGKKQLTTGGRSPAALFGRRSGTDLDPSAVVSQMGKLAKRYAPKGKAADAELQDFHSFRQALNVASGDQRLLVLTVGDRAKAEKSLKTALNDSDLLGVFHHDFADAKEDADWLGKVAQAKSGSSFVVIQSDEFGLKGKALAQLPLTSSAEDLKKALLAANRAFAKAEKRKVYSEHVRAGRRQRVYFENEMPYGEDRDGDGKIDESRRRRR